MFIALKVSTVHNNNVFSASHKSGSHSLIIAFFLYLYAQENFYDEMYFRLNICVYNFILTWLNGHPDWLLLFFFKLRISFSMKVIAK